MEQPDQMNDRRCGPGWRGRRMGWLAKLACAVVCVAALGAAVMLLWNWVVPPIFPAATEIGFWRALGLLVLCRILFGGFRGNRHWHEKKRRMQARWQGMTPEERERMGSRMCGFGRQRDRDQSGQ